MAGEWSAWEICISLVSGGGLVSSLGFVYWIGWKSNQVDSLRNEFDEHKKADKSAQMDAIASQLQEHKQSDTAQFRDVNERIDKITDKLGGLATRDDLHQLNANVQSALSRMGDGMTAAFNALTARLDNAFRPRDS
jgi:hypothetical protein